MAKSTLNHVRKMSKKWNKALEKKTLSHPVSREAYERTLHEIEIALKMRKAREKANLTQEDVAERMHTTRTAVSRLESCGTGRHSPSIETLLKYAQALGYSVNITFVATKNKHYKSVRE